MERRGWKRTAAYVGLLAAAYVVAVAGSWVAGGPLDNAAYDYLFRLYQPKPWQPQSVLLAIDEATLAAVPGGMHGIRKPLAAALELVAHAAPKAVAVDVILAEQSEDPAVDRTLAKAFCDTPNLVLSSELVAGALNGRIRAMSSAAAPHRFWGTYTRSPIQEIPELVPSH